MGLNEKVFSEFTPLVHKIASDYSNKYRMVDLVDLRQELWIWFLTHPNKTKEWLEMDNQKEATKMFAKSLRNAALDYCLKEKAALYGYAPEDNFFYNKEFIKELLPAVLTSDARRIQRVLDSGNRTYKDLSELGDWMAFASDVRGAYSKLQPEEQRLVFLFYAQDVSGSDLHEQTDSKRPSARADMMAANRALGKMVKSLGGYKPYHDEDYPKEKNDLHTMHDGGGYESNDEQN